jgi:hypothetical protein
MRRIGWQIGGTESLLAVRLLVLKELDALAGLFPIFLLIGAGLQRLLLPSQRFRVLLDDQLREINFIHLGDERRPRPAASEREAQLS